MRRLIYILLIYILIVVGLVAPANAAELKLAAWNIAWLNAQIGRGQVPRTESDYDRLANYVRTLNADIVALAEVQGEAAARRIFDPAVYTFHFEERQSDQAVGFAIKKDINFQPNADLDTLNVSGGLRRGVDISINHGGVSLRLLSVHLKSGCWDMPLDSTKRDCQSLRRQVPILESWIDARAREGVPFIVLGDFNRRFDSRGDDFWPDINDGDPSGLKLHRLTAGLISKCWNGRYPQYIDHIIADDRALPFIIQDSFQQMQFEEIVEDKRISDHCPISVRLILP